ncbi:MAG: efflux RND transporter periplasmic adaptor subunit [bacterium]|nr:efflux RND transporter periplasmic adaptor subunit [bacterium]
MTENKKKQCVNTVIFGGKVLLILAIITITLNCGGPEKLELAGTLERRTLEVSAPISEIIVELPVEVGDHIKKDTIIVQLDTEVVAAELRAHEAALSAAQALLKEARGEFSRQEKLRRARVSSPQAYDKARRQRDEAFSLAAEKEARIAQAKKRLADLTIRARVSGTLDQLPYELGERVPAGGVVAVVIADDNPWVRVWLPARAVVRVKIGQGAKAKIEGLDKWFDAKVEHISREPEFTPHYALTERESAHLVYETKVRLTDARKDLPAGMPARVVIPLKED